MPTTKQFPVSKLYLDLKNFRTTQQKSERSAIKALIDLKPEWFWALMNSLLDDGFHPTENVIVLKVGHKHVVKEGNRRIAAMKLILGLATGIDVPTDLKKKIKVLSEEWISQNSSVPCAIYSAEDAQTVDTIVARTHGYNDKAARSKWEAVARARHARDMAKTPQPALDLLEKYIRHGSNASNNQKNLWAGDYPLTVLDEALKKMASVMGYEKSSMVVAAYPKEHSQAIDQILFDIGEHTLKFKELRASDPFWGSKYGFERPSDTEAGSGSESDEEQSDSETAGSQSAGGESEEDGGSTSASANSGNSASGSGSATSAGGKKVSGGKEPAAKVALASTDPKGVKRAIKAFRLHGNGRDKLETLRQELQSLKMERHPHAFLFVLRSMFEISAKVYCDDQKANGGPDSYDHKNKREKQTADLLREIVQFMTKQGQDKIVQKRLHGAIADLASKDGLLSITSMNQLIHSTTFSVQPKDISLLFHNIFPLLSAMNA